MTVSQPAPERLIKADGQPHYGHFDGMPKQFGIEQFDYRNNMDRRIGSVGKYFHYKQFQFVSIVTPRYVIGIAIADIRYLGSSFCYLYDRDRDTLVEQSWLRPLMIDKQMSPSCYSGTTSIAAGKLKFIIEQGRWRIKAASRHVQLDIELHSPTDSLPLSVATPTGYSGWTYTQKHNALSVTGTLQVDGKAVGLNEALAGYDFSAGYMRRETSWRWASINARGDQTTLGLNLAAGVNETGSGENVLWVNGQRHLLSPVHFQFSRQQINSPWQIYSDDKQVELTFTPLNQRSEKLNLWLLKSNFRQFIGHFSGVITDNDGQKHHLDSVLGLTEDHYAKW